MASRRWLRGQSDAMVSLSAPRPLTTLGASRSMGPFDEVSRVYEDFATALPPYQRPYAWTSEQVDDLWDDLAGNVTGSHFLGSVVLSSEEEMRPQVIDGQQRLTTLMLLLSVLRDACHERDLKSVVDRINKRLIADDLASGDAYFKFKTSPPNWPVFRALVLGGPGAPAGKAAEDFDKPTRA